MDQVPFSTKELLKGQTNDDVWFLGTCAANRDFDRVQEIRQNWEAIRVSLELTYGEINSNPFGPHNRHIVKQYLKVIEGCMALGVKAFWKQRSHQLRLAALHAEGQTQMKKELGLRGGLNRVRSLFVASTITRALVVQRPAPWEIAQEECEAIQRITTKSPEVSEDVAANIDAFLGTLFDHKAKFAKKVACRHTLPRPMPKCVIEAPTTLGGGLCVFSLYGSATKSSIEIEEEQRLIRTKRQQERDHVNLVAGEEFLRSGYGSSTAGWGEGWEALERKRKEDKENDDIFCVEMAKMMEALEQEGKLDLYMDYDPPSAETIAGWSQEQRDAYEAKSLEQAIRMSELWEVGDALTRVEPLPVPESTHEFNREFDLETHRLLRLAEEPRKLNLAATFEQALRDAPNKHQCRTLPIVDEGGKIRVATVHTASVAWLARSMSAVLFPHLKHFAFSSAILKGEHVKLVNNSPDPLLLFSADFRKSTDPISVSQARRILDGIRRRIPVPSWWDRAVENVITRHAIQLPDGTEIWTECGALMGLGPGWAVLCILNAWAAENAGAPVGSFAVCGDDLIALWTRENIACYRANIRKVMLALNDDKCYCGPYHGVFCEQLVVRTGKYTAECVGELRIGEAVACKLGAARDKSKAHGALVVDNLRAAKGLRLMRRLANRVADRHCPSRHTPGSLGQGGGGGGRPADAITVVAYAMYGPAILMKSESRLEGKLSLLRTELRRAAKMPGSKTRSQDIINTALEIAEAKHRETTAHRTDAPEVLKTKVARLSIHARRAAAKSLIRTMGGTREALNLVLANIPPGTDDSVPKKTAVPQYVNSDDRLRKRVVLHATSRRFELALKLLQASWRRSLDPIVGVRLLDEVGLASEEELQVTMLDLHSASRGWSSNPLPK
jgi:hypothetical protein